MLSIEEIKLLIEKLKVLKQEDFQSVIDESLAKLEAVAENVDYLNNQEINRLDKTKAWYALDEEWHTEQEESEQDRLLYQQVCQKIAAFSKMGAESRLYNCLEIGHGTGRYSRHFLPWRLNYYLDINPEYEKIIRERFKEPQQKYLKFYTTDKTECKEIPRKSVNFVFSWNTFVYFTQEHIAQYLKDIKRVFLPGGYAFIHYADCDFDHDLEKAKRGYWNYNTKRSMKEMIETAGYEVIEMDQFRPGANYVIFKMPGDQNPVLYQVDEIPGNF